MNTSIRQARFDDITTLPRKGLPPQSCFSPSLPSAFQRGCKEPAYDGGAPWFYRWVRAYALKPAPCSRVARSCVTESSPDEPFGIARFVLSSRCKSDDGLERITAGLAGPQMTDAAAVAIFRPVRHVNALAALGTFNDRARTREFSVGAVKFHRASSTTMAVWPPSPWRGNTLTPRPRAIEAARLT
jgi:hypothetical protein